MALSRELESLKTEKLQPRINKHQLDTLGTLLGLTAGIFTVLGTQEVINPKIAGTVSGIATVCLGYVVQRPVSEHPTTDEAEKNNITK
jgi:hypothetical protein